MLKQKPLFVDCLVGVAAAGKQNEDVKNSHCDQKVFGNFQSATDAELTKALDPLLGKEVTLICIFHPRYFMCLMFCIFTQIVSVQKLQ